MNKSELIKAVANSSNMTQTQVAHIVEHTIGHIEDTLARGEFVDIHGFGKFSTATRKARTGRNPHTGDQVEIPERTAIKFKPKKHLTDLLN